MLRALAAGVPWRHMKTHRLLGLLLLATAADAAPTELARLLTADGAEVCCAALSGRTIVAFVPGHGDAAYVFVEPEGGWAGDVVASATLRTSDGGQLCLPSIWGDTVVALHCLPGGSTSPAYVFVEPPGGWKGELTETGKLTASVAILPLDIAVQDDFIVLASGVDVEPGKDDSGAAHVYLRPRRGWTGELREQARLRPRNPQRKQIEEDDGDFVDLAVSGNTIFAAAHHEEGHRGSVYAFTKPTTGWHGTIFEAARLTASDRMFEDHFGRSISVWGDTLVVECPGDRGGAEPTTGAYVFVEPPGGWSGDLHEQARLFASEAERLETPVISRDTIIGVEGGRLYVFLEPADGWQADLTENLRFTVDQRDQRAFEGDAFVGTGRSRVFRLGLDADQDGLSDSMESKLGTDPRDEDSDEDGIADGSDPEWVADRLAGLENASLANHGAPRALLGLLRRAERLIAEGDLAHARATLARLRRRMDGCEPAPDGNDLIVDCAAQREVRELVDVLRENLER